MIKTVIFDLDDTLYDEAEYCKSGLMHIAACIAEMTEINHKINSQELFEQMWTLFNSADRSTIFNTILQQIGIHDDPQTINKLVNEYRSHTPDIKLPQSSKDVLDALKPDYDLALLTDGFLPAQKLKVQALGIEKYFKCIIYTEDLGREHWKPSTKGFEIILNQLDRKPPFSTYVADNAEKDFIAPNKLTMHSIQLIRPNRIHKASPPTPQAEPEAIIKDIKQLPALIKQL